jgi:AsmA-like C-terminal region/AsmA family
VQTTLLGLAIAFIIALVAALVGPYFIDWNQFRPQFEAEASRIIGIPVQVSGELNARLLPAPSLRLRAVMVGGARDVGKIRADKLDVEFSLGSLMRGQWRANELTINGMVLDLGLDSRGRIDWPAATGKFNLGSLAIDRLNLTGRIALRDAASVSMLELKDIAFSGDVRSLAGSVRGDGNATVAGIRYPFRIFSGQTADNAGTRVHVSVEPGERALSMDLDGLLSFTERTPRFEGTVAAAVPAPAKAQDGAPTPWRVTAKVKADPSAARLEQIEANYGAEDRALKFTGLGDIRFGSTPRLHAALTARQLDADTLFAKAAAKPAAAEPVRWISGLRTLVETLPVPMLATQIELSAEQIMLGGRPVQNLTGRFQGDATGWSVDGLDFRAPGTSHIAFTGAGASPDSVAGALELESSDPDVLVGWMQARSDIAFRNQKPLRLRGKVRIDPDRAAIEALKAEIDGGTVEGRIALSQQDGSGSRFEAALKADRLDLDAATAFARAVAGPQGDWPDQAQFSLDLGVAISSGQELRPFTAKFGYDPKSVLLDNLKFGNAGGVTLESHGNFDRIGAMGSLEINATAATFGQLTGFAAPFAPSFASRLNALGAGSGPVRARLAFDLGSKTTVAVDRVAAQVALEFESPQFKGSGKFSAQPKIASVRGFDFSDIGQSEIGIEAKLSAEQGRSLLAMLGLDRAIAAGDGPARFEGSGSGVWNAPLRLNAHLSGNGLDADLQGTAEPFAADAKANLDLRIRKVNLAPLFGLKPSDSLAQNLSLTSRVSLAGNSLKLDDLDSSSAGARLRGHLALTLGAETNVEGDLGLDTIDLAPGFALAIGAADHDATEPLGTGLLKGWRGRVAFQALRGVLPGGGEMRPFGGVIRSDGQSLIFDALKGGIGGAEATATIDTRQGANGLAVNASVEFTNIDSGAMRYRGLKMPPGRASLQMTLASQGRSLSALSGAVSGSGTVTLQSAGIAGLDPRAFEVAIRASDNGQATDDAKLRQIVEPILAAGSLKVAAAQVPFNIRDGRLRIGATTLDAEAARAIVSGGYDVTADQVDIRASLTSTTIGLASSRPEIQLFVVGSPDALTRSVDVSALSSWLAVRAIDRETRRLDSIEHGEPPALPASIPPSTSVPLGAPADANTAQPDAAAGDVALPGRDPRRFLPRGKVTAPRSPVEAPVAIAPSVAPPLPPLPAPIELKPPPGALMLRPKPRPPLALSPPGNP